MAVTNPLAFSQSEQDTLWPVHARVSRRVARCCGSRPAENAPVVPEDADRGPGPGAAVKSHSQWLDMRAFVRGSRRRRWRASTMAWPN